MKTYATITAAGVQPHPAGHRRLTARRRGTRAVALACAIIGAGQAAALSFAPVVTDGGVPLSGPLQLTYYNNLAVNLNPGLSSFSFYSGRPAAVCNGAQLGYDVYCVTAVYSTDVPSETAFVGAQSEGYVYDGFVQDKNLLTFGYGSAVAGTFVIDFTETFTETRTAVRYATNAADGAKVDLGSSSVFLPAAYRSPMLDCDFSAGKTYLITVASCSLKLTFAAPAAQPTPDPDPTPTPAPTPTPSSTVPEPSSWAMLLGGFALIGTVLRRRRPAAPAFGASL